MANPTTFSQFSEQLIQLADQGDSIENLAMKLRKLQNKHDAEVQKLSTKIRKLEDQIQHLDGEKQGFKESLNTVVKGMAVVPPHPPRKAIQNGPKKPCSTVACGEICPYGEKCHFSHTVLQRD